MLVQWKTCLLLNPQHKHLTCCLFSVRTHICVTRVFWASHRLIFWSTCSSSSLSGSIKLKSSRRSPHARTKMHWWRTAELFITSDLSPPIDGPFVFVAPSGLLGLVGVLVQSCPWNCCWRSPTNAGPLISLKASVYVPRPIIWVTFSLCCDTWQRTPQAHQ